MALCTTSPLHENPIHSLSSEDSASQLEYHSIYKDINAKYIAMEELYIWGALFTDALCVYVTFSTFYSFPASLPKHPLL